jgi:hypothetical protein
VKNATPEEWARLVVDAQDRNLRYDFQASTDECSLEEDLVGFDLDAVWTNRDGDPVTCQ